MFKLVEKIYTILNACKEFTAGYDSGTAEKGYLYIEHEGKAYAVKIVEMPMRPDESSFTRIDNLTYYA